MAPVKAYEAPSSREKGVIIGSCTNVSKNATIMMKYNNLFKRHRPLFIISSIIHIHWICCRRNASQSGDSLGSLCLFCVMLKCCFYLLPIGGVMWLKDDMLYSICPKIVTHVLR